MPQSFSIKTMKIYEREYLKVFPLNNNDCANVHSRLQTLKSVRKVNINNEGKELIVYPSELHTINETKTDVQESLTSFYKDTISSIAKLKSTKEKLDLFDKSKELYKDAIKNIEQNGSKRETLDDLRLALELLLQKKLNNNCTLEKQKGNLSDYLKSKKATNEIRNNIVQSLDHLYHYQNNHVKHDNNIKDEEVDYMIEQTNNIINQLLRYEEK